MANNHQAPVIIKNSKKSVDDLVKGSFNRIAKSFFLMHRYKIKTWKGILILGFMAGFVSALSWAISTDRFSRIMALPGDIINNTAQVAYNDADGNSYGPTSSNTVSITQTGSPPVVAKVTIKFPKDFAREKIKAQIRDENSAIIKEWSAVLDNNNNLEISLDTPKSAGNYFIMIIPPQHLSEKINVILDEAEELYTISEDILKQGNLFDADDVINAADWQIMRDNWGSAVSQEPDLNQDGLINTLDWSLMKKNWGVKGDCPSDITEEAECRNRD